MCCRVVFRRPRGSEQCVAIVFLLGVSIVAQSLAGSTSAPRNRQAQLPSRYRQGWRRDELTQRETHDCHRDVKTLSRRRKSFVSAPAGSVSQCRRQCSFLIHSSDYIRWISGGFPVGPTYRQVEGCWRRTESSLPERALSRYAAVLIGARCVNACGKFPRCWQNPNLSEGSGGPRRSQRWPFFLVPMRLHSSLAWIILWTAVS